METRKGEGGRTVLVFIFCCHAVGFLLFSRGFLLKRVIVPEYSKCSVTNTTQEHIPSCHGHLVPRPFKRVLWVLIDALRYDFMVYDDSLDPPPVFRNKMPFVRDLLQTQPANARLFKFVADPPTTTMQRLKALTTGSLPTFIDIGSNFNSYTILEDSLPYQAKLNDRNVTFIGDDTWLGLYPDMMTKTFDYPSLNVQDLDTVDNGVIENLGRELAQHDADIVIGHMLGVDHVGHTYGPSHWTMGKKLAQMNDFIEHIFTHLLDEDTLVFVLGDHGMSPTGDHGGETSLETDAALLVYSAKPLFNPSEPALGREVFQIDIVPTTAMAVGLPIPFSNLGTLILEVFLPYREKGDRGRSGDGFSGRTTPEFLAALRINAVQIHNYLVTYTQYSQDFPVDKFNALEKSLKKVEKLHRELEASGGMPSQQDMTDIAKEYVTYMRDVKLMCHSIWAKFDNVQIAQGLFLVLLVVVATPLILCDVHKSALFLFQLITIGLKIGLVLTGLSVFYTGVDASFWGALILVGDFMFFSLVVMVFGIVFKCRDIFTAAVSSGWNMVLSLFRINFLQFFSLLVVFLHASSMLSNSFILYEADMLAFFIQSLIFCFAVRVLQKELARRRQLALSGVLKAILPHVLLMVCVRSSKVFYACRDFQFQDGCEVTSLILPLASAMDILQGPLSKWRFAASSVAIALVPFALIAHLRWSRNHESLSCHLVKATEIGFPVCVVCVVVHWAMQSLPQATLHSLPHWQHVTAPRVVYAICTAIVMLCVARPFKTHLQPILMTCEDPPMDAILEAGSETASPRPLSPTRTAPRLRKVTPDHHEQPNVDLKQSSVDPSRNSRALVVVVISIVVMSLWIPAAMILNDGVALSAVLTATQMLLAVKMLQCSEDAVSWEACVLWGLLGYHSFFSFGHHATVTSLRFEAGFVGIHGEITEYNLPLAAILVGINTVASQVLYGLGFPLLLVLGSGQNGHHASKLSHQLLPFLVFYSAFNAVKLLLSMVAASLHRRHLMLWRVFAPRFLYEAVFQAITDVSMVLALTLVNRLEHAMKVART